MREAVDEMVRRQIDAGIDIVNDGEMSKPSYATYVKDRLSGFGGSGNTYVFPGPRGFPQSAARVFGDPGRKARKAPACNGPDRSCRPPIAQNRHGNPCGRGERRDAVHQRRIAGRDLAVLPQRLLQESRDVSRSHREAMRYEYETVVEHGATLQLDCPDLAMGRHVQYSD